MRDITLEDTVDFKFTTAEPDTGAPITLAGTPVISAYVGNSTTQITAGITLTVDFDGVTGLHNVRVAATAANGYTTGTDVALIITTGTVDGVSAVGYKVAEFTIGRQASLALRPTVAGRTLDVSAGGEAGIDWNNIGSPTTAQNLSGTNIDVDQAIASVSGAVGSVAANGITLASLATSAREALGLNLTGTLSGTHSDTTADLGTSAPATDVSGQTVFFPDHDLSRLITSYNTGTGVATFDSIGVTLANGNTWYLFPTAPSSGGGGGGLDAAGVRAAVGLASANLDTQLSGIQSDTNDIQARLPAALVSGRIDASVGAMAANVMTAAAAAADLTTELQAGLSTLDAAGVRTAVGLASANLDTQLSGIQSDTDNIQTRIPAALVSGRMDASVGAMAANVMTAAAAAADLTTELQSGLATAADLATVDANVDSLVSGIIFGAATAGTLSTTQATTNLTGYANDQLIGRVVIWLTGNCEGEASDITDYANASGLLTFTALTTAPGNGDTFKIV